MARYVKLVKGTTFSSTAIKERTLKKGQVGTVENDASLEVLLKASFLDTSNNEHFYLEEVKLEVTPPQDEPVGEFEEQVLKEDPDLEDYGDEEATAPAPKPPRAPRTTRK